MIEMHLLWITRHRLRMIGVRRCRGGHKHPRLGAARNPHEESRLRITVARRGCPLTALALGAHEPRGKIKSCIRLNMKLKSRCHAVGKSAERLVCRQRSISSSIDLNCLSAFSTPSRPSTR